jgi:hypothetical protein
MNSPSSCDGPRPRLLGTTTEIGLPKGARTKYTSVTRVNNRVSKTVLELNFTLAKH